MPIRRFLSTPLLLVMASCGGGSLPNPATSSTASTSATLGEPAATTGPVSSHQLTYEVVATYPHDPNAFTQGLETADGILYESTGLYGESDRRIVDLETGNPVSVVLVDSGLFAEGLTLVEDRVIQLTWQSGVAIVANAADLAETNRFSYDNEGWGLCLDSDRLVMSDGSSSLTFRDPATFESTGTILVTRDGIAVDRLNELECVDGTVYANVWQTTEIVAIDPGTGKISGTLDLTDLVPEAVSDPSNDVLNGIAYRAETGTFLVTGKRWPALFEIRVS